MKRKRKPMPKPSRPFGDRKRKYTEKEMRRILRDYHKTFIARNDG